MNGEAPPAPLSRHLPLALLVLVILAVTALAINQAFEQRMAQEVARLQTISDLKTQQISDWLRERREEASYLQTSPYWSEIHRRWRVQGDAASRERLLARLDDYRLQDSFEDVLLLDIQGHLLWASDGAVPPTDPDSIAALLRAADGQSAGLLGPYRDEAGRLHIDFVAQLSRDPFNTSVLVLHADPADSLYPILKSWPVPSTSAEIVLFRRDGDQVLFLNDLRKQPDSAAKLRVPVHGNRVLAAQVLRGEARQGEVVHGEDYRRAPTVGVVRLIPGTDWGLVAKIDLKEIRAEVLGDSLLIGLAGLLAMVMAVIGIRLMRQRQELDAARQVQHSQSERLRALRLLAAIADSSSDAIFALDQAGRFLLFNRGAALATGKGQEQVLGQDESVLFPPEQAELLKAENRRVMEGNLTLTFQNEVTTPAGKRIFLTTKGPLHDAEGQVIGLFGIARDITERQQAEDALRRANRALRTISECNQALVRAADEAQLLADICRLVVEFGGYRMAWVGWAEEDAERSVRPVAQAGADAGTLAATRISWADDERGQGPTGTAIRERRVVACQHMLSEPQLAPWQAAADHQGYAYAAAIALPLRIDDNHCLGALTLYASEAEAFDSEEVQLLTELANDLAFGIRALRDRSAKKSGETELRRSEELFRSLVESAQDGILMMDAKACIVLWNAAAQQLFGWSQAEAIGQDLHQLIVPARYHTAFRAGFERFRTSGQGAAIGRPLELIALCKDGSEVTVEISLSAVERDDGWNAIGIIRNITDRKHVEQQLRDSEERYRMAFRTSPDAININRLADGLYLDVNEGFERTTGWLREEVIGKTSLETGTWHDPADRQRLVDALQRDHYCENLEAAFVMKDGEVRIGLMSAHVISLEGQPCILSITRDITDKKQAENTLRASETRHRTVLAALGEGVYGVDRQGLCTFINAAALAMLGYTEEEVLGQAQHALFHHHHADGRPYPVTECPIYQTAQDGQSRRQEDHFIRKDGSSLAVEIAATPLHSDDGRLIGAVAAFQDIGARLAAEAQLRKLVLAVEQSPESIAITNLKAELEYVNEAFVRNTGYSREEAIGQNPRMLHSDKTPQASYDALWQALTQGQAWKGEFINRRKDGSEYTEFAVITPLRQPDGAISHYVAVKEDISEKKRIAEELDRHRHHLEELVEHRTAELAEAQQRAEAASLAKSTFLANMSHEIRTPMNAIVGLTHLLKSGGVTPAQAERLNKIDHAAHHLLSVINDILDLSKIEAGRLQLEQTDFALASVLDNVYSLIADQARAKHLSITLDHDTVPPWLHGDPTRLRQALLNYAGNAVKFTEQGSIDLRARLVEDGGEALIVRFEVQDTGIGIAPEHLSRLFQAFEQADASTTRQYGGSGLGLAIARRLAQMMGGEAGAESMPGQGSTFWFTARLERGRGHMPHVARIAHVAIEGELLRRAGARVLLVEDNLVNQEVALDLLREARLEVETAIDGFEAVAKAGTQQYDLILMDVQMPRMNGLDATRAIRALPEHARIPILAMTANAFNEDRQHCLAAGMNDFVAKPVDPQRLFEALIRWLPVQPASPAPVQTPPPAGDDAALRTRIESIPGLDAATCLHNLRGRLDKYLHLLHQFALAHDQDLTRMASLLASGKLPEARQLLHSLKGVCATLGAVQVRDATLQLEIALHNEPLPASLPDLMEAARQALAPLIAAIQALPEATETDAAATPNPTRTRQLMTELAALLSHDDTRAIALLHTSAQTLRAALGEGYEDLALQIEGFEFEAALATLRCIWPEAGPE